MSTEPQMHWYVQVDRTFKIKMDKVRLDVIDISATSDMLSAILKRPTKKSGLSLKVVGIPIDGVMRTVRLAIPSVSNKITSSFFP